MIRQPAIGADSHGRNAKRLLHHATEGIEVPLMVKNPRSSHAPIEHMENRSPRRDSRDSGHGQNLTKAAHPCQYMRLSPLILPFNPPL